MSKARTTVECYTAERVGRALYQGYTASCPEELAKQCGAAHHKQGINAFTQEEIMEPVEHPYGDREQPPDSDYKNLLTGVFEDWEGWRPDDLAHMHQRCRRRQWREPGEESRNTLGLRSSKLRGNAVPCPL